MIRPNAAAPKSAVRPAGQPTTLPNAKYSPAAKLWAGVRGRSAVRGTFRAIKAPLLRGADALSEGALQFLFCQALVWRTPHAESLESGLCKCGFPLCDDHFLGCVASGSSMVHDVVVAGVMSLIHTFGYTHVTSLLTKEPTGTEAGYDEDDRHGPDLRLDGMRGRAHAMVVDITGVSPVATKGWVAFLLGHVATYPDPHRTGMNPVEKAAHRKRTSADAAKAAEVECDYLPAVFLRTGGSHLD
jgi:hypothetical protein